MSQPQVDWFGYNQLIKLAVTDFFPRHKESHYDNTIRELKLIPCEFLQINLKYIKPNTD